MWELLFLLLFWSYSDGNSDPFPPKSFRSHNLSHLVIPSSPHSEFFYVGGTNFLYQLNRHLEVVNVVKTGPHFDSALCHASGCESRENVTKQLTDNVNKALVLDKDNHKLIYCGSLYQGSCWKYNLENISSHSEFVAEPVAANDLKSSTFAFIGPQGYNRWGHSNVLYVGTTYTGRGDYRHDVPAISSRQLHDLKFAEFTFSKQSLLRIDVKYRDRFLVKYVYGFNSSSHIYFVTVQKKSHLPGGEENGYVTRLSRVCISDANYDTYTEVTLDCHYKGEHYDTVQDVVFTEAKRNLADQLDLHRNDSVLIGVFGKSYNNLNGAANSSRKNDSAVCIYNLVSIERQFEENIHKCFNGSMRYRNLEYISGPIQEGKCPDIGTVGNIYDFCEVGLKISGSTPISVHAYDVLRETVVTAFLYHEAQNMAVFLAGTNDGRVLKYLLLKPGHLKLLEIENEHTIRGAPIFDIHLIKDEIMTLQQEKVSLFSASVCEKHPSCGECLNAKNPFCGWCSLYSKCSLKSLCKDDSSQWLSPGVNNTCLHLEKVSPSALAISDSVTNIDLTIQSLPILPSGQKFLCVFDYGVKFEARTVSSGLICPNPLLNFSEKWKNDANITLSLTFTGSETNLLDSLIIPIYNCSKQLSCRQCSKTYDCFWCMETSSCLLSKIDCPSTALIDYGLFSRKYSCPSLDLKSIPKIPNDITVGLRLPFTRELPSVYRTDFNYWCLVNIENAKFKVSAKLEDSVILCDSTQYNYLAEVPEISASLTVLVNNDDILDKAEIILYKCSIIGSDCSLCKSSDSAYGCDWCNGICSSNCINASSLCPMPEVHSIQPNSGPLKGGTIIHIAGNNLAIRKQDAIGKIYLGSHICQLVEFQVSVSIKCRTPPVIVQQNVSLIYNGLNTFLSFQYKEYYMTRVSPSRGPIAGGTTLTISGVNLNIGSSVQIYLDRHPCVVIPPRSLTKIKCKTSIVQRQDQTNFVHLIIDNEKKTFRHKFTYTHNPVIHEIKPTSSFISGGRIITVHGQFFSSIQEPEMLLHYNDGNSVVKSTCFILNSRLMECESPSVQSLLRTDGSHNTSHTATAFASTASNYLQLDIGFKMDNVTDLVHLSRTYPNVQSKLSFFEDPKYYSFRNGVKKYKGDELVLEGAKLNLASNLHDVRVIIGSKFCNVTSLTESQLVCFPPTNGEFYHPGGPIYVIVKVGRSLRFNLGELVYDFQDYDHFSSEIIGGISAAAVMLVFLAIAGLILFKHKSSQAEREYKRIQIQMDTLENNVRSECKQAFAELQTDMTDLTLELEASGIPIRDHRKYVMNVFFPGVTDHPILQTSNLNSERSKGVILLQLEQLMHNKCFLLTLIDTLERQPSFSVRDRVNFASLMTVVTCTNMEYLTDVLRSLLLRLIEKSISSRHPQLMLRRTESVVEKLLTNWLALCLYGYMKDYAGSSLFLLFKAIKCQIEKGPVDFISQEAKYSLTEGGLLREPCSYSVITCYVLQREFEEAFQTKVLDCDTISQVKSKILNAVYKNTPFSMRPSIDEVDLEWQCGQDAHVVLQDLDLTTKDTPKGKRLNTLSHYGVKGKAVVSLVPRQVYNSSSQDSDPTSSEKCYLYHLKEPDVSKSDNQTLKTHKAIPEVFLTRLLSTKGTIQKFIDDFFTTVFSINSKFPPVIKWLYDIFDDAAVTHNISSSDIIHSWKANSVPLRFWVNFIKNPDFIFDVEKNYTTDTNLSIVAQTFMDSCSSAEPKLNKESPSHKLLFAKDIMDYRGLVKESFELIKEMPQVSDQDLNYCMHRLSVYHEGEFNQSAALREVFMYINQYYHDLYTALNDNKLSKHLGLAIKLENIYKSS